MNIRRFAQGASTTLGVVAAAALAHRAWRSPPVYLARMSGTSISAPDAVGWVTDFLNAAYYARRPELRNVEDLRIAFAILTTRWHRLGHRRLHAPDVLAFHRAFVRARLTDDASRRAARWIATTSSRALPTGSARGFRTPTSTTHAAPTGSRSRRSRSATTTCPRFASSTPSSARRRRPRTRAASRSGTRTTPSQSTPRSARPKRSSGPRRGRTTSDIGRFTLVRSGGLLNQTFEIEVISALTPRTPVILRGYVTVTRLLTCYDDEAALTHYANRPSELMVRFGRDQPPAFPPGCAPRLALCLDTHEGHFMGRGRNRLLIYELHGQDYLRAAGTWDDMPVTLEQAYRSAGRKAQDAFWGDQRPESSMLEQIAPRTRTSTSGS